MPNSKITTSRYLKFIIILIYDVSRDAAFHMGAILNGFPKLIESSPQAAWMERLDSITHSAAGMGLKILRREAGEEARKRVGMDSGKQTKPRHP
jgi:hypothetical protein